MSRRSLRTLVPLLGTLVVLGALWWLGRDEGGAGAGRADLPQAFRARVDRVVDGDTVKVVGGDGVGAQTVRLIGIDTPESVAPDRPVECFGPEASARTAQMLPEGTEVTVELDPGQGERDKYDRVLGYVHTGASPGAASVNRALLEEGYARLFVFEDDPFRYAPEYRSAEREARLGERGLWGSC